MINSKTKTENNKDQQLSKVVRPIKFNFFSRLSIGHEKDYLLENLSMLVSSGMAVASALASIEAEVQSKTMKRLVATVRQAVEEGSSLWSAFEKINLLAKYDIALIRQGEKSGHLAENLQVINLKQTKENEFRTKVSSAVSYPVFVLFFVFTVGVAVAWLVLPRLASTFEQMQVRLPFLTRVIIDVGTFFGHYGWWVIPVFVVIILALYYFLFFFQPIKFIGQTLIFNFPISRRLVMQIQLSRLGFILGTLLGAGLPIVDAVDSLESATTFYPYRRFYTYLKNSLENGNSFQKSFSAYPSCNRLIPAPIQQMIVAGEQSGRLPETFLKIGDTFEAKIDITAKNFANMLEPILLILVGLGVALVAMGIILPIYSLIGSLS